MAGLYDLMLLIDPNAPEERRTAAVSEAESLIGSGGELVASHDWGQRRMAYEIDHRPEADYRLYQFNGDNALLERLNQRLRINDAVLRFRIIKAKPGQPLPPPPEQQSAAPPRRPRAAGHPRGRPRRRGRAGRRTAAPARRPPADAPAVDAAGTAPTAPPAEAPAADAPPADGPARRAARRSRGRRTPPTRPLDE